MALGEECSPVVLRGFKKTKLLCRCMMMGSSSLVKSLTTTALRETCRKFLASPLLVRNLPAHCFIDQLGKLTWGEDMSYTLGEAQAQAQAQAKCLHMAHWLTNCANRCIIINNQEVINTLWYGNKGVGNLRLIGLVGLGPASRVFTFHLDSLLTATTNISICPHMTSYSNMAGLCGSTLYDCERRHAGGRRYLHDAHPYPRVKRGAMADTLLLSLASRRRPGTVILVGFEIALTFLPWLEGSDWVHGG